jgi:hypothetical protein
MDKQTRISRIVGQFLGGRFSAPTEERVQRWLVDPRDAEEKEAASLEFWDSLDPTPDLGAHRSWKRVAARAGLSARGDGQPARSTKTVPMRRPFVRRVAGIAASILIPLMAVAGGLIWRAEVRERAAEAEIAAVQSAAAEVKLAEPLAFEGASVGEIFTALEERFGVTIEAPETMLGDPERYTVKFPRGDSFDDILNVLGDVIGEFEYIKTGNNITITNK